MRYFLPLVVLIVIIARSQRRFGRPSFFTYGAAAYLLAVLLLKVPWLF